MFGTFVRLDRARSIKFLVNSIRYNNNLGFSILNL